VVLEKEKWIAETINKMIKHYGDRLNDQDFEYIAVYLESAWNRGYNEMLKES
jgi:hypothetical protein